MPHFPESNIITAASEGNVDEVRKFLESGVPLTVRNCENFTILHFAIRSKRVALIEFLLEQPDAPKLVNAKNVEGESPLHFAAKYCGIDVARKLIDVGAKVSCTSWKFGTPLHVAARCGDLELVKLLVATGVSVNARDQSYGFTPLHSALRGMNESSQVDPRECPHMEVAKYLVENGAALGAKDRGGSPPIVGLRSAKDPASIQILLEETVEFRSRKANQQVSEVFRERIIGQQTQSSDVRDR